MSASACAGGGAAAIGEMISVTWRMSSPIAGRPSSVPVIVDSPSPTPFTSPTASITTAAGFDDVHSSTAGPTSSVYGTPSTVTWKSVLAKKRASFRSSAWVPPSIVAGPGTTTPASSLTYRISSKNSS